MGTVARPILTFDPKECALEYYSCDRRLLWQIPVENIMLMAEYTTDEGPLIDDYFVVFVASDGDEWNIATASFYSDGRDRIVRSLAQRWGSDIELSLSNSTEWKSRVAWPSPLVGREYFEFREVVPRTRIAELRRVAFGPAYEYFPSQSVRDFLRSRAPGQ
jgi:hypothetical protein